LEELSRAVELDLRPKEVSPKDDSRRAVARGRNAETKNLKEFDSLKKALRGHLENEVREPDEKINAAPEFLQRYLANHRAALTEIVTQLRSGELPGWEVDDMGRFELAYVDLLWLERLCLVEALESKRVADDSRTADLLDAAWRLNLAILSRPEAIGQSVGFTIGTFQAAVVRKVGGSSLDWSQRFGSFAARRSLARGLQHDALYLREHGRHDEVQLGWPLWARAIARPWLNSMFRIGYADFSVAMHQSVSFLGKTEPCDYDLDKAKAIWGYAMDPPKGHRRRFPIWDAANAAWPDIRTNTAPRFPADLRDFLLSQELTLRVLQAREATPVERKALVETASERSTVCPDGQWLYSARNADSMRIKFSRIFDPWPVGEKKFVVPLVFEVGRV
jgi:hypothetical protein